MREITANPRITIPLGRQGENNAVRVKFPISSWNELYGNGAFELLNVRPNEKTPYTCSITADDDFVYWVVQSADVAIVGHGKCELTYVVDGTVAKSVTFGTCVLESIEGAGTVPAPYESRIADLIEASANITVEADRAETAREGAEEAERGILGLSATASVDNNSGIPSVDVEVTDEEDHKNMDFAFHNLKGDKGDKGDTGEQGPKGETGDTGAQGPKGDKGDTGATGAKGDKGEQGIQGERGETGATPNISIGTVTTGAAGTDASATMTGTPENPVLNLTIPRGDEGEVTEEELQAVANSKAPAIISTASGTIASFDDGVADSKMQKLVVNIEPVQSGTGDPSPDNVRPITGWTEATVTRTGKNLLEPKFYDGIIYNPSVGQAAFTTLTDVTNTVTKDGNTYSKTGSTWNIIMNMVLPLNESFVGKTLKFSGTINEISGYRCAWYIADAEHITKRRSSSMNELPTWSITIQEGDAYLIWFMNSSSAGTFVLTEPMIELGSTASTYEPYQGETYDITFPSKAGTVYGGTLDVTSGVLTVDRAKRIISSFEGAWGATNNGYAVYIDSTARSLNRNIAKCNQFKMDGNSYSTMPLYSFLGGSGAQSTWTFILPSSVTSLAEANEWLSNLTTPLETIYALDTPATYTLTAQQVTTLLGTNNVWADTGDVEVTYYADSKIYIDDQNALVKALIAPVLDSMVADTALVKNDFRIVNNTLYRATTTIASGATLTVGTNVVATTLAEVIKPLLT